MDLDRNYQKMKIKMCIGTSKNETNAMKKNKREEEKLQVKLKQVEREKMRVARLLGVNK